MKNVSDYKNVEFHIILTPNSRAGCYPCEKVCYTVGEENRDGNSKSPINIRELSSKERCGKRVKSEIHKKILKKSDKRHI
jgi:hypothetical protein